MAKYDELGREIPDPTPVEMPVGFRHPPSLNDEIQRLIRNELSQAAAAQGAETFEEADDFDVDDDDGVPFSEYEVTDMQAEVPRDFFEKRPKRNYRLEDDPPSTEAASDDDVEDQEPEPEAEAPAAPIPAKPVVAKRGPPSAGGPGVRRAKGRR